jgi:hypothetical protein
MIQQGRMVSVLRGQSFLLGDGIGEAVAELVVGERNGTVPVGRVPRKGKAAFSEDSGSGSTPQNGAASIATVAAFRYLLRYIRGGR